MLSYYLLPWFSFVTYFFLRLCLYIYIYIYYTFSPRLETPRSKSYPSQGGYFRNEAILLLRKFYVRENDHGKLLQVIRVLLFFLYIKNLTITYEYSSSTEKEGCTYIKNRYSRKVEVKKKEKKQ